jgi:NtrC-family two-component system sensor histidine kinase KinB
VAHDLRNPLTSVKGWAVQLRSLGEDGPVDPVTAAAMLDRVIDNADRMQRLIGDLLEHATTQGAELQTGLASVTRLAVQAADAVGVRSTTTVERTPLVLCDKALVTQLLTNLLQNAVKYVAPGVTPQVHLSAVTVGNEVSFTLTDNGTGIGEHEQERVFERFYRGATEHPGTGLGLSICRTIVERHGGAIRVEAGPAGVGSSFVFTLPAAVAPLDLEPRSAVVATLPGALPGTLPGAPDAVPVIPA